MNRYSKRSIAALFVWVASACVAANAQGNANDSHVAQVRAAFVGRSIKPGEKVDILLRDLSVWEGKVTAVDSDSFNIKSNRPHLGYSEWTIPYKDVLRIRAPKLQLEFIADPAKRPHGAWDDVTGLSKNRRIIVRLKGGKEMIGRFGGAGAEHLTLLGHTDDAFIEIPRVSVESVHGHFPGSGGVGKATRKGMRIGTEVPPNRDAAFIGTAFGAGVGAIAGLFNHKKARMILVYSR